MPTPSARAKIVAALPGCSEVISRKTGVAESSVRKHLRQLQAEGNANIARFVRTSGHPAAYWVAGPGENAEPPAPQTTAEYSRAFRKRVEKAIERAEQGKPFSDRYRKHVALHQADQLAKRLRGKPANPFAALGL